MSRVRLYWLVATRQLLNMRKISDVLYSLGDIRKIIYLGFEKSQRSVTHDSLRYINILTYLL